MSVTMHRPCMTSYMSVNPTTKHLSLVRHGHLRCLPSLPETSTEGTEIYAMSAIEMHSDMISTCSNLDTQNWCLQWCIIEQICEIISHATLSSLWPGSSATSFLSSCVGHFMTSLSRPRGVWNIVRRELRPTHTGAFQNQGFHWNDCKMHGLASNLPKHATS